MRVKLSDLYDIGSSKRVFQSEWRKSGVPFYRAREIAKLSIDGYMEIFCGLSKKQKIEFYLSI